MKHFFIIAICCATFYGSVAMLLEYTSLGPSLKATIIDIIGNEQLHGPRSGQ